MLYVIDICYIKKFSGSIVDAIVKLVLHKTDPCSSGCSVWL